VKGIDSNDAEANVDTDDLFDIRMQSEKRAHTERGSNEHRLIKYERTENNRDIYSSDVIEKSPCKLNETDTTDWRETVKTGPDVKTSFRKITENKDVCDKDLSYNRRPHKHELGASGMFQKDMYGGDERQMRKRDVGLSRQSIKTEILLCKMRITSMVKCKKGSGEGAVFPLQKLKKFFWFNVFKNFCVQAKGGGIAQCLPPKYATGL